MGVGWFDNSFVCLTSMATGCVNAINRPVGRNGSSESDDNEMQSLQKLAEKRPQFLAALRLNSVFDFNACGVLGRFIQRCYRF